MLTYGSVCSCIEAATIAWGPLGLKASWFAQFDPDHNYKNGPDFPSAVLAYRWPEVQNLLGSSVAVSVMQWIGNRIIGALKGKL